MKLKSHIYFWSFIIFVVYLIVFSPFALNDFVRMVLYGIPSVAGFVYLLGIFRDRRKEPQPEKEVERECCPRCSGTEPWPGDKEELDG